MLNDVFVMHIVLIIIMIRAVIVIDVGDCTLPVHDRLRTGAAEEKTRLVRHDQRDIVDQVILIQNAWNILAVPQNVIAIAVFHK